MTISRRTPEVSGNNRQRNQRGKCLVKVTGESPRGHGSIVRERSIGSGLTQPLRAPGVEVHRPPKEQRRNQRPPAIRRARGS